MTLRIQRFPVAVLLALAFVFIPATGNLHANPNPPTNVSLWLNDEQGTFIPGPDYRSDQLGPEYYANRPTITNPNDEYVSDEVILRFRPDVPVDQQNALMAANGMHMGRPIYKERAFVAKVAPGRALTVANALRGNPLLEIA